MANADVSDSSPAEPRVPWIVGAHYIVAFLVMYFGGFALHLWTTHLFFTNWGTFAAIIAFCMLGFAEVAAILLVCFWWGPWFYILAIAAWLTALAAWLTAACALFRAEEFGHFPRTLVWPVSVAMCVCVFGFTFFAVRAATTPKIVSESEREEIEEVASVMCALLNDYGSFDSDALSGVMVAKDRLRRKIGKYDALRRSDVRKIVDSYLHARALFERDFRRFLEDGAGANGRLTVSEETRQAFSALPAKIRLSADDIDVIEESYQQAFKASWTSSRNVLERYHWTTERQWRDMREVYEDLLTTPMPSREEFLAGGNKARGGGAFAAPPGEKKTPSPLSASDPAADEVDRILRRAEAHMDGGDYDSAIADYTEAIRLDPNYARAYFGRGMTYCFGKGDYDSAIADYTEAIRLDPKDVFKYFARGWAYRGKGQLAAAERDFAQAKKLGYKP